MACATAAVAALWGAATLAGTDVTTIATEAPFPPYVYVDDAGRLSGFDKDVADEVCARAALTCAWETARFDRLLPGVASGLYDIAVGGIAGTPARARLVDFSIPYEDGSGPDYFIGRPGAPAPDAPGVRIGAQSGTIHADHLRTTNRPFRSYATEAALLAALAAGEIDLAYGGFYESAIGPFMARNGLDWLREEPADGAGVAMAVCKGNTALLTRVNAALEAMTADGTMDRLNTKWGV